MIIGGIQKFSLVDYPGVPSAVIFLAGCNMRCGYCHNPELVLPERYGDPYDIAELQNFLTSRISKLHGVVITGGEPTLRKELPQFIQEIKSMGFKIKLDTNGTNPRMLKTILEDELVDYVAMDIKGPPEKYIQITQRPISVSDIQQSIDIILSSKIRHEFRTTAVKSQLSSVDFERIGQLIKGAQLFSFQKFVPTKTLDPCFADEEAYTEEEMNVFAKTMNRYVQQCVVR